MDLQQLQQFPRVEGSHMKELCGLDPQAIPSPSAASFWTGFLNVVYMMLFDVF